MPTDRAEIATTSATELLRQLASGRTTSVELVDALLERIERHDAVLGAFVTVDADGARRAAREADAARAGGDRRPLLGLPISLKDSFATAGLRTTSGRPDQADHVPDGDAVSVARLRAAGAVVLGKTNLPTAVSGQETANVVAGRTRNPWDLDRTPGGSSGGAAAALAAGLTPLELGSDSARRRAALRRPAPPTTTAKAGWGTHPRRVDTAAWGTTADGWLADPGNGETRGMQRTLTAHLDLALRRGDAGLYGLGATDPVDERDALLALAVIHDLHLGPIDRVGPAVRFQHHPVVAELKARLESEVLRPMPQPTGDAPDDAVREMRRIGRLDAIPAVYDWLAEDATWEQLVDFLALEGGPDAGFDDLVAVCQVGLAGEPKLELARNYWDEMGRGDASRVHTELHHLLCRAIDMPAVGRHAQPTSGLRRTALGNVLATNRYLQPELVGALGLLELQAGPRCRKVVRAMERLGASDEALAFYVEHAEVDPHHGKGWVDNVIAPLAADPAWAERMVLGARWRSEINAAFFAEMAERCVPGHRGGGTGSESTLVTA